MKKYMVESDLHIGGPDEILLDGGQGYGPNVIRLGDNREMKQIPHDKTTQAIKDMDADHMLCVKTDTICVTGNHELGYSYMAYTKILTTETGKRVLVTHGHFLWKAKKRLKWEKRLAGNNKFLIAFSGCLSKMRNIFPKYKLSKKQIKKAIRMVRQYGCTTILFGHTHPTIKIDIEVDGIRIVNVPRGRSEVWL